jgi:catechol 2,3-dioxygenase-like lactoylglutathione lyase family enzyme
VKLSKTIPAMPVRDAAAAADFYRDRLGFDVLHHDSGVAVFFQWAFE